MASQTILLINGIISVISIFFILNIFWFYRVKKRDGKLNGEKDFGLIWLAIGFFFWTLTGIVSKAYPGQEYLISFLSLANNGVFICSFTFFDHGIDSLNKKFEKRKFFLTTAILTLLLIGINLFLIGTGAQNLKDVANIFELIYSGIMLAMFAGILFNSFFIRKLYGIAFASLLVLFLVLFIQILGLLPNQITVDPSFANAIYIASHSLLLTIVISLSFSWVIEKIEENYDTDLNIKGKRIVNKFIDELGRLRDFLKDKIADNQIELVLLALKEYYKEKFDKDNLNTIILKMSDFYRVENQLRNGITSQNEASIELNVIKSTLLGLIDKIE